MNSSSVDLSCRRCGQPLPPGRDAAACPHCLVELALEWPSRTTMGGPFAPPAPEELRQRFPWLQVVALVGGGGMGAVYEAVQPELDRRVALKILPAERSDDVVAVERFRRECRVLAKFDHPHIVRVVDCGHEQGLCFLLMEFVDGANLRELVSAGPLPPDECVRIALEVCDGVHYAHEHGVIHRDLKPENILVDERGQVKIADFGIAKWLVPDRTPGSAGGMTLTNADRRLGTPRYMAPEQSRGDGTIDERTDLYALGVVFYEMLTGTAPTFDYRPPSRVVRVDRRWDAVVAGCLKSDPAERPASVAELRRQIERIGATGSARRPLRAAISAGLIGGLLAWGWNTLGARPALQPAGPPPAPIPTAGPGEPASTAGEPPSVPPAPAPAAAAAKIAAAPSAGKSAATNRPPKTADSPLHPVVDGSFRWSEPRLMGPDINSAAQESHPTITSDGLTLLFLRDFRTLYQSTRASLDDSFGVAMPVGGPVNEGVVDAPFVSGDGLTVWFASGRSGSLGNNDLWVADRPDRTAAFGPPLPLEPPINTPDEESTPALTPDRLQLFFSRRVDGKPADIFYATRKSVTDRFEEPRPLPGDVNTPFPEFFPRPVGAEGNILFLATTYKTGQSQSVRLARRDHPGRPYQALAPHPQGINVGRLSAVALYADDRQMIFDTDRTDGMGGFDLWHSRREKRSGARDSRSRR